MHWSYLQYLWRHKRAVWIAGRKLKVSRWQLLIHDWSKFTPKEWWAYARKFYGPQHTTKTSARFRRTVDLDFLHAWHHHVVHNKHHWNYWVAVNEGGKLTCLLMPERYVREMVADWWGAGHAKGERLKPWYAAHEKLILLHPLTRHIVEQLIEDVDATD